MEDLTLDFAPGDMLVFDVLERRALRRVGGGRGEGGQGRGEYRTERTLF